MDFRNPLGTGRCLLQEDMKKECVKSHDDNMVRRIRMRGHCLCRWMNIMVRTGDSVG